MNNLTEYIPTPEEITEGVIFIFGAKVLTGFSLFIVAIIIAQYLGSEGLGIYSVVAALYAIFHLITFFGLNDLVIRELAKDKSRVKKFVSNLLIFGMISSMICFAIMGMLMYLINYSLQIRVAAYIMGLGLLPNFCTLLSESVFIAFKKAQYVFYVDIVIHIGWVILTFIVLSLNQGIYMVMWSFLAAFTLGAALSFYYLDKYITPFYFGLDFSFLKKIVKSLFIFALIAIVDQILIKTDVIVLSKIRNITEVGWYSAAYRFLSLSFLFTFSFTTVMFPVLSKLSCVSKKLFEDMSNKSIKYLFFFVFPLVVFMMFFSDNLILFGFGKKFVNSIIALQILIWALIPFSVSFLLSKILIAKNKQDKVLFSLSLGLMLMLVSTIIMTYRTGYVGTAEAVLFAVSVTAICQYLFVRKYVFKIDILSPLLKVGLSAFCMLTCILSLNLNGTNKYLSGLCSLGVYLFFIYILRLFTAGELQVVRSICHKSIQRITKLRG